ncbi:MAG: hypothetical protein JWO33_2098, partial [Caulobacteraceae bacterium]|nr:hypothetical protein [Caulobacteraceae bacterium]
MFGKFHSPSSVAMDVRAGPFDG